MIKEVATCTLRGSNINTLNSLKLLMFHANEAFKLPAMILLMELSLIQMLLSAYLSSKNSIFTAF